MSRVLKKLNDGAQVPWIAFGTGTALYGREAAASIQRAIKAGFVHLDTAEVYRNEESVGRGLAGTPRSQLFITTKVNNASLNEGKTVKQCLQASLSKLGVDYVDLYLIHTPIGIENRLPDIWRQFEEVQKDGLAKSIGVSNFRLKDFDLFLKGVNVVPAVNQIEYHPYVAVAAQPLLALHKEYGIATASYGGQTPVVRKSGGPLDPVLLSISERLKTTGGKPVTAGQVLMKYLQFKDIFAITTSSKEERLREYLEVTDVPDLTGTEVEAIDAAGSQLHYRHFQQHMDK